MFPETFLRFATDCCHFDLITEHFSGRVYSENRPLRQAYVLTQKKFPSAAYSLFDITPRTPAENYATVCILAASRDRLSLFTDSTWNIFLVGGEEYPIVCMAKAALDRHQGDAHLRGISAQLIGRFDCKPDVAFENVKWNYQKIDRCAEMRSLTFSEISKHNKWLKSLSLLQRQEVLVEIAREEAHPWFFSGIAGLANPRRTTEIIRHLYHDKIMNHLKKDHKYRYCHDEIGSSETHEIIIFRGFNSDRGRFCFERLPEYTWPNDRLELSLTQALELQICAAPPVAGGDSDENLPASSHRRLALHKRKHDFFVSDSETETEDTATNSQPRQKVCKKINHDDTIGDVFMTLDGWAMKIMDGIYCWFMTPKDIDPEIAARAKHGFYLTNYETINLDIQDKRVVKCCYEEARIILDKTCPDSYYCDSTSLIVPFPDCVTRGHFNEKGEAAMYAILSCLRDSYKVKVDFGGTVPTIGSRCNHAHLHLWNVAISGKKVPEESWDTILPRNAKCGACGLKRTLTVSVGDSNDRLVLGNVCAQRAKILLQLFWCFHHTTWHVFACMFLLVVDELDDLQSVTTKKYTEKFYFK